MRAFIGKSSYKLAVAIAIISMFMLIWLSLGVGIIGEDGHPANLMYFAVVAVGIVGAIVTRLQPAGMKRVMLVMALVHGFIALVALVGEIGLEYSPPFEIFGLTILFIGMFSVSAWLFQTVANMEFGKKQEIR